ncbi:MAG: hypothetical protein BMS9Abin33_0671 [Gammaproteobacteria bacterium]|nr:MAG: hypothetical protein BMS9Abin33_0671 [Gammaproteobacteria bacterium]
MNDKNTGVYQLKYRKLWLSVAWILITSIIVLSLIPSLPDSGFNHGDKIGHITAYALATWWLVQLYPSSRYLLITLALVSLGILLEVAQGFSPYRHFDVYDALANTTGVAAGWLVNKTVLGATVQKLEKRILSKT